MVGILSYGAYVPIWRIDRSVIAQIAGTGSMGGERSFGARDEDSLTMAVEAGLDCLAGYDPKEIDGLYFATASSPFKQKLSSSIIASALDLRKDVCAIDFSSSVRAGTSAVKVALDAVKAGSAKKILVVASDHKVGRPGSEYEQMFGDAAAALLIGDNGAICEETSFATVSNPIPGPWQTEADSYLRTFEPKLDRLSGVLGDMPTAVNEVLNKAGLTSSDISKFALAGPDPRSYRDLARTLKFDPKAQMEDPMFSTVGLTGTSHALLLLVSAMEKANPGDNIVCVSHGEGSDAFLFTATGEIEAAKGKHRGTKYVASKKMVPSYGRFAEWQGTRDTGWPPKDMSSSVVTFWREEKWAFPFYGMKCNNCGTTQYPQGRACINCRATDNFEEVRIAPRGKVFTFAHDYIYYHGLIPGDGKNPGTRVVSDMEDGCRILLEMVDCEKEAVEIDMPIELTFRLLHDKGGYRFYGWRARPVRG
jgi:hydroxymethylglutaryl-CoA synthase